MVSAKRVVHPRARLLIQFGGTDTRRWRRESFEQAWPSWHLLPGWIRPGDVNRPTPAEVHARLISGECGVVGAPMWQNQHVFHIRPNRTSVPPQ